MRKQPTPATHSLLCALVPKVIQVHQVIVIVTSATVGTLPTSELHIRWRQDSARCQQA
jgi:hypothetical protein